MDSYATRDTSLPTFERPPVSEVVLGLMFRPLPLQAYHLAQLHGVWSDDYPRVEEHPAIPGTLAPGLFFQMQSAPELRFWFISDKSGRLIQAQKDRLILNWRSQDGGQRYPRYEELRSEIIRRVGEFKDFLTRFDGSDFSPIAVEVTYINAIGTKAYVKLSEALNFVANPPHLQIEPVDANLQLRFDTAVLLKRDSNLIITASRDNNREPAPISLQLSSHAQVEDRGNFVEALDQSHELVVMSFRDITTDAMHKIWGLQ